MQDHLLQGAEERRRLGSCDIAIKRLWEKGAMRFRAQCHRFRDHLARAAVASERHIRHLDLVFQCAHGKHRSVAMGTVFEYCLSHFALVKTVRHNKFMWGRLRT